MLMSTSIDWWLSESALLTTFITPFGRYCFQHLPFGISSAPEHFQRHMQEILEGVQGVVCLMDDVLVIAQKSNSSESPTSSKQPRASKRPKSPSTPSKRPQLPSTSSKQPKLSSTPSKQPQELKNPVVSDPMRLKYMYREIMVFDCNQNPVVDICGVSWRPHLREILPLLDTSYQRAIDNRKSSLGHILDSDEWRAILNNHYRHPSIQVWPFKTSTDNLMERNARHIVYSMDGNESWLLHDSIEGFHVRSTENIAQWCWNRLCVLSVNSDCGCFDGVEDNFSCFDDVDGNCGRLDGVELRFWSLAWALGCFEDVGDSELLLFWAMTSTSHPWDKQLPAHLRESPACVAEKCSGADEICKW